MSILNSIITELFTISSDTERRFFDISAVWIIKMAFKPNQLEHAYEDTLVVIHTIEAGSAFCPMSLHGNFFHLMGRDARHLEEEYISLRIAALDSAYSMFRLDPNYKIELLGTIDYKARARANVVADEISRIALRIPKKKSQKYRVLTIGSVGNIIHALLDRKFDVVGTDLDPTVIGAAFDSVVVQDGNKYTLDLLSQVDIALVTAMTLSTETIDSIISVAKKNSTKLVMFAQTGANFAPRLLKYGIDTVVSEHFPFYMFPGNSLVEVFRKD
jgi:hypothetical protein